MLKCVHVCVTLCCCRLLCLKNLPFVEVRISWTLQLRFSPGCRGRSLPTTAYNRKVHCIWSGCIMWYNVKKPYTHIRADGKVGKDGIVAKLLSFRIWRFIVTFLEDTFEFRYNFGLDLVGIWYNHVGHSWVRTDIFQKTDKFGQNCVRRESG